VDGVSVLLSCGSTVITALMAAALMLITSMMFCFKIYIKIVLLRKILYETAIAYLQESRPSKLNNRS
jgi:hypothetical protein